MAFILLCVICVKLLLSILSSVFHLRRAKSISAVGPSPVGAWVLDAIDRSSDVGWPNGSHLLTRFTLVRNPERNPDTAAMNPLVFCPCTLCPHFGTVADVPRGSASRNRAAASAVRMRKSSPRTSSTGRSNARASSSVMFSCGPTPRPTPNATVRIPLLAEFAVHGPVDLLLQRPARCPRRRRSCCSRSARSDRGCRTPHCRARSRRSPPGRDPIAPDRHPRSPACPNSDGERHVSSIAFRPPIESPIRIGRRSPIAPMNASASNDISWLL